MSSVENTLEAVQGLTTTPDGKLRIEISLSSDTVREMLFSQIIHAMMLKCPQGTNAQNIIQESMMFVQAIAAARREIQVASQMPQPPVGNNE